MIPAKQFLLFFLCVSPSVVLSRKPDCSGVKAISPSCSSNETPSLRDFFYVGGHPLQTPTGNITINQVYVEKISPISGSRKRHPIVFFHGGGGSAVTWLNTPDNRKGWASYFVSKGYTVYLVDAYAGARSPANNFQDFTILPGYPPSAIENAFTRHTATRFQFPGSGTIGDPAFEAFQKTEIPWTTSFVLQEEAMRAAGCELLRLLGTPAYLISHSLGSFYPVLLSNDCPALVQGSVNLEPATTPFWRYNIDSLGGVPQSPWGLTFSRLSYDPPVNDPSELVVEAVGEDTLTRRNCYQQVPPARQLPNVASVPYLGLAAEGGTENTFGHCIINYLKQVGVEPEWIYLKDIGIRGNGHFMHIELNNLRIAKVVENWMAKTAKKTHESHRVG